MVGWSKDREGVGGDIAGADVRGAVDIVIADVIVMLFLSKFGIIMLLLLLLLLNMTLFNGGPRDNFCSLII